MGASHVYVRALVLGCFYSHISMTEVADRVGAQLRGDKDHECPFSGVTKSGRVWRKVPESDARSVPHRVTSGQSNSVIRKSTFQNSLYIYKERERERERERENFCQVNPQN